MGTLELSPIIKFSTYRNNFIKVQLEELMRTVKEEISLKCYLEDRIFPVSLKELGKTV